MKLQHGVSWCFWAVKGLVELVLIVQDSRMVQVG